MSFGNRAWLSAVMFVCALLSAAVSARAEDDDENSVQFAALPSDLAQAAGIQTVPFSNEPIEPAQYNGDVRDLPADFTPRDYLHHWNEFGRPLPQRTIPPSTNLPVTAPVMNAPMPSSTSFAGLALNTPVTGGTAGFGFPPDTNGDVGPVYYIESVNDAWGIFNKSTGALVSAFTENQLWSGASTGTACDTHNQGDPVVIHDGAADRWILSNFAFTSSFSGAHYQCIAVSKTSDPVAGGWWLYAVRTDIGGSGPPANSLLDYPKFGVWTDCLYMGGNVFTNATTYGGGAFATFSRTALFAGTALGANNSSVAYTANANIFGMFPATLSGNGTSPPAGRSEYFVVTSPSVYGYDIRKYVQGANVCGSGGSLSAVTTVNEAAYGYPATVSGATSDIVPQPSPGNKLDSLGDEIMQRVVYRNIGGTESLWVTHTTCGTGISPNGTCSADTNPTKVQWSQINVTGGTIATTPVQQQIYAPDATFYRWLPSLAVDGQGNMAIGYSRSNATAGNYPTLAYSGRLVGDTLNQLPQTETVMVAGGGAQSNICGPGACARWGDYSAMTIDPADDCTFWFTSEYYDTIAHGASGTWQTRIGSFKFPSCVPPASKLVVTTQPSSTYASGATITVKVSIENAGGNVVTTDTSAVTLALSGGTAGAVLSGTKTVNAVAGVATFSTLSVDKIGSSYVLNATDASLTGAASTPFNITVGVANTVTFTTQPAVNANIGAGVGIPLVAHVVDAGGNPILGQNIALSILNNPGTSTLSVTTNPVGTNASGDATFSSVSLNKAGTGYTLKATDNSTPAATAATSNAFNIVASAAKTVTFTTQPALNSNIVAGATIPLVAHVADIDGNAVANHNVALSFGNNVGGSTLTVTTNPVATNAGGDAVFASVSLNRVGNGDTLVAMDNTLPTATPATSNAFNIVAGAPTQLAFLQQPTNGAAGVALSPAVTVRVLDSKGNVVSADTHSVTLTVASGPGGFDPGATRTVAFGSGVATFNNLVFDVAGTGYTLSAADAGDTLTSAPSSPFNIIPGAPRLIFTTEPANVARGNALGTVAVTEDDGAGNVIPDSASSADFTITTACGTFDLGSATMNNGVATLVSSQAFYTLGSGLKINATTGPLSGTSASFSVVSSDLIFADSFDGCRL